MRSQPLLLLLLLLPLLSSCSKPPLPTAVDSQPYELPTAFDSPKNFHVIERGSLPVFDNRYIELFDNVMECYPIPSHFDARWDVKGSLTEYPDFQVEREIDRTTQQELVTVRLKTAEAVTLFFTALENYGIVNRKLHLMQSLERRSQVRMMRGLTPIAEQEGHLKDALAARQELTGLAVQLNAARLNLLATCKDDKRGRVDNYLKLLIESKKVELNY